MKEKANGMILAVDDSQPVDEATTNHRSGGSKLKKLAIEFAAEETRVIESDGEFHPARPDPFRSHY
jgi:hypothetical protein